MKKCSWCGQEIDGRRIRIRFPGHGTVRICRHCASGFAGVIGYTAGLIGELVARRPRQAFRFSFGSINDRSER